ncbi:MAG: hypothetical protein ACK5WZ_02900 [Pseudobdellovibrionaceae bacterium]
MLQGLNRGSFSFVALLVINPILIIFYQNCSIVPLSDRRGDDMVQSQVATPLRDQILKPGSELNQRNPASEANQLESKLAECGPSQASCTHQIAE